MKVELVYYGELKDREFLDTWTFKSEATRIFPSGTCRINVVSEIEDTITLNLNEIPARIDLCETGDLWLGDARFVKCFPHPYHTLDEKSKTVWTKPVEAKP